MKALALFAMSLLPFLQLVGCSGSTPPEDRAARAAPAEHAPPPPRPPTARRPTVSAEALPLAEDYEREMSERIGPGELEAAITRVAAEIAEDER